MVERKDHDLKGVFERVESIFGMFDVNYSTPYLIPPEKVYALEKDLIVEFQNN